MTTPRRDPLIVHADLVAHHDLMPMPGVAAGGQVGHFEAPLSWEIRSGRPVVLLGASRAAPSVLRQIYTLAGLDPQEVIR